MQDLISRRAAIDVTWEEPSYTDALNVLTEVRDKIRALPTVVEPQMDLIDTEGLYEQIRCEMCRNPMHTDRGCDGNCKYDEKLYERIIQILVERIKPSPLLASHIPPAISDAPDTNVGDSISRQAAIDKFTSMPTIDGLGLQPLITVDDAVNSLEKLPSAQPEIGESLYRYKCFITDAEGLQHEVVHVGDIRRVTGWDI